MNAAQNALFVAGVLAAAVLHSPAEPLKATLAVSSQPLHGGRVSPMIFGNFMELLDDLVPSMWAEMLNDRSFEGVTQRANWAYGDGALNFCDREWEKNESWTCDTARPCNGARSARLTSTRRQPALLRQSGLAVKRAANGHPAPYRVRYWQIGNEISGDNGGSEDRREAVIFAVNSRSEPVACSVGLDRWDGAARLASAEALCDTLDARQSDVMNHWNTPDRVRIIPLAPAGNRIVLPALSAAAIECKVP